MPGLDLQHGAEAVGDQQRITKLPPSRSLGVTGGI